jgi:cell division protein FtsL
VALADVQPPEPKLYTKGLLYEVLFVRYNSDNMNEQQHETSEPRTTVKKSKGTSKIVIILLLTLIILGSVSYSVYSWLQNQQQKTDLNSKNAQISKLNDELSSLKSESKAESKSNVIPIKELGISITVPDSISDITYSYESYKSNGTIENARETVGLSTKSLTDTYASTADCTSFDSSPPLGTLSKVVGVYPEVPNVHNTPGRLVKQFDGYYIAYTNSQSLCANGQTSAPEEYDIFIEYLPTVKEL